MVPYREKGFRTGPEKAQCFPPSRIACQMLSQTERHQERTITKQDRVWVKPLVPKLCTLWERRKRTLYP